MNAATSLSAQNRAALRVAASTDCFGEQRGLGVSTIAFKVCPQDSSGVLILENTFHAKGGPARHLHVAQFCDICSVLLPPSGLCGPRPRLPWEAHSLLSHGR